MAELRATLLQRIHDDLAAQMGFFHLTNVAAIVETWSHERLLSLEQRLIDHGHEDEAGWVRELNDYPADEDA